jgi:hypothetical protein
MAMDLAGVGNVAQGAKASKGDGQELKEFSVKRGDNGGVIVCETYRTKVPEGRRSGSAYPEMGKYTENPFSPDDGKGAHDFVKGLMGKLGLTGVEATEVETRQPAAPDRFAPREPAPMPSAGNPGY